jgi:hypothetical protein
MQGVLDVILRAFGRPILGTYEVPDERGILDSGYQSNS